MSGPYIKTGGSLKLKGGPAIGPSNKKSKSSSSKKRREQDLAASAGASANEGDKSRRDGADESDEYKSRDASPAVGRSDGKTEAQRKFEEVQRKRLLEKAAKAATKTHKDRVAEFNTKLENMSEHYDLPRIGPG